MVLELTGKQRAQLRALANGIDTILIIGKDGISPNLLKQADDALSARELIKCRVLETAEYSAREACQILSERTGSAQVQVIGTRFVLYRPSQDKDRKDRIVLTKPAGKAKDKR